MADGLFGSIASGSLSGASKGAALGSALMPGIGTGVGAGVGALFGGISAGQKQKAARDAQNIPLVDPMERAQLARLEQERKSISAGTDAGTQQAINQSRNVGAAAQGAIARSSGGDVGTTLDSLMKSQRITQQGVNQAVAQGQSKLPYFESASGNLLNRISQRKLELSRLKRDQLTAEAAQAGTENNINANAVLGAFGGNETPIDAANSGIQKISPLVEQGVGALKNMFNKPEAINFDFSQPTNPGYVTPMGTGQEVIFNTPQ